MYFLLLVLADIWEYQMYLHKFNSLYLKHKATPGRCMNIQRDRLAFTQPTEAYKMLNNFKCIYNFCFDSVRYNFIILDIMHSHVKLSNRFKY